MKAIIDYSILFYRFWHMLESKKELDTNSSIEKFIIEKIEGLKFELNCYDVILAADKGMSFRKKFYRSYKGNRLNKDKELKKLYWSVFNNLQSKKVLCEGLEADDLCYIYAYEQNKNGGVIVVSSDSDMHQVTLLNKVELYCPFKRLFYKGDAYLSLAEKIYLGDAKDNVKRCVGRGCGPKTLRSLYHKYKGRLKEQLIDIYGINEKVFQLNKRLLIFNYSTYKQFKIIWKI